MSHTAAGLAALLALLPAGAASAQMSLPGKFAVNATGAATYTVPIAVPPGTAGMTPSLTLEYNSQGGNGILGLGWSLGGLPSIGRCAPTIAQDGARGAVTYTYNDRFCLEGQRLIAVNGAYGADGTEYRTEIDSYSRIISWGQNGNGPSWFEVHTKSGQIMQFGNTSTETGNAQAFVQCTQTIRSWALNRVSDAKGNYYTVKYNNDTTTCDGNGQVVPQEIDYTGNSTAGIGPYNKVLFLYQDRPDNLLAFEGGAQQRTKVLLTNIQTFIGESIVSNYQMTYSQTPSTARSILTSITPCGTGLCLPATTFTWNTDSDYFQPGSPSYFTTQGSGLGIGFTQADVNGDGKADLIAYAVSGNTLNAYVALSNGNGTYGNTLLSQLNGNWGIAGPSSGINIAFADINGDGRADLVAYFLDTDGFRVYVAFSNGSGGFWNFTAWASGSLMGAGWGNGVSVGENDDYTWYWRVAVVDINGDGRADVVAYLPGSTGLQTFSALGTGNGNFDGPVLWQVNGDYSAFWSMTVADIDGDGRADLLGMARDTGGLFTLGALSNGNGTFGNPMVSSLPGNWSQWNFASGDINGDGRTDVIAYFLGSGGFSAQVALSRGDGNFTFLPPWQRAIGNLTGWSLSVGDLNGDGRADLIAYKFDQSHLYMGVALAQSNGQFADPVYFPTADGNTSGWQITTADVDGDGRADLLAFAFTPGGTFTAVTARAPSQAMAITSIATGLGALTNVLYVPLTASNTGVYFRDSGSQYPLQDVQGPLYVVAQTWTSDGVGGFYSACYNYVGAKLDLTGRGFLGFRQRSIWDAQTNIFQTINYRQDFPYIGLVDSEIRSINGQVLNRTTNYYGAIQTSGPRWQVFLSANTEQSFDLDGTAMPIVTTSYAYDAYNNPTQVVVSTPDGYSKTTTNGYTNDATTWVLGRLTNASVTSTTPSASGARTSSFAYDSSGLLIQEVVEPNTPALRLQTDYTYDSFGNKIYVTVSGVNTATRSSSTGYDPQGQFAIQQTNALSQSESWQYDARFGKPIGHTGPNVLTTTWQYDAVGRKTLEVRPGGTRTYWAYGYCNGGCLYAPVYYWIQETPIAADGVNQNGPLTVKGYDRLDREVQILTQGFDGSFINIYTEYDSLGRIYRKSRPFFRSGGTPVWTYFTYDALGRVTVEAMPDGSSRMHDYHGLVTTDHDTYQRKRTVTKNSQGQPILVQEKDSSDNVLTSTSFTYDPFGNVLTTTDNAGNVVSNTYDLRGRKIATNDPDLGNWTYAYDALSQVVGQTDAKGQHTLFTYDVLGRLTERDEPDMIGCWAYGTAAPAIGKVVAASVQSAAGCQGPLKFQRTYVYDSLGRPTDVGVTVDGINPHMYAAYDGNNRLILFVSSSGLAVSYNYTSLGFLQQASDARSSQTFWTANARDAELHLLRDTAGNGVATVRTFDPGNGRLTNIRAGINNNNAVAAFDYTYDFEGRLSNRTDYNNGITETFAYDWLYRVVSSQVRLTLPPATITASNSFTYDPIGNLVWKSGVGNYSYPAAGQVRPHAVSTISGGAINTTFSYDNNGNQTSGLGRSITYTSYNKPASITQGSATLSFADDASHQRYRQTTPEGTIYYFDAFGMHEEFSGSGSQWGWTSYLTVGGAMIGMRVLHPDSSVTLRYFHQDHLGSIGVITNESGAVVERNSYDVWGKRRFADGHDDPSGSLNTTSQTIRGFTGEEFLADVGLVHLNGRVYDPLIGRMMSADPVVGDPLNGQTWNRYSYVYNSPLTLTDPTGFCPAPVCIGYAGPPRTRGSGLELATSIIRIAAMAACAWTPGCQPFLFAAVTASASTMINGGDLHHAMTAGAIAGATAVAFNVVGDVTLGPGHPPANFNSPNFIPNVVGHALVGCGSAVASGGKCGAGALSAGIPAFAGPIINKLDFAPALVANSAIGGLASVAGGGKFANGAVTAAFGYLFNAEDAGAKSGIFPDDPIQAKLQSVSNRAIAEFDASGDSGFSQAQLDAINENPNLRNAYRGYNIDGMVRRYVAQDPELNHLTGRRNAGVDFIDPRTGIEYEMTTPGQWSSKVTKYGEGTRFINTGRPGVGGVRGGGGGAFPGGGGWSPFQQYHFPNWY